MKLLVALVWGVVVAIVQFGGVQAQSIESFDPPAFNDNRVTTDLLFMYTFDQDECEAGAFVDKRNDTTSLLGDLTYNTAASVPGWGTVTKCPSVNISGTIFENAYHGTKSQGQRAGAAPSSAPLTRDDSVVSSNNIAALQTQLGSDFTIELWIRPAFDSDTTVEDEVFVLFEIGQSFPGSGSFPWTCAASNFDVQLRYDNSAAEQFLLTYRDAGGNCRNIVFDTFTLSNGVLYHLIVKNLTTVERSVSPSTLRRKVDLGSRMNS